jgi:hypothetical protein
MLNGDDPKTFRDDADLFDRMRPSEATLAAARALRFMADEIEHRRSAKSCFERPSAE